MHHQSQLRSTNLSSYYVWCVLWTMFFGLAPSWEILSTSAVWRKNSTIENQFVIDCKNFHWISQKTKNAKKKKLFFFFEYSFKLYWTLFNKTVRKLKVGHQNFKNAITQNIKFFWTFFIGTFIKIKKRQWYKFCLIPPSSRIASIIDSKASTELRFCPKPICGTYESFIESDT